MIELVFLRGESGIRAITKALGCLGLERGYLCLKIDNLQNEALTQRNQRLNYIHKGGVHVIEDVK